MRLLAAALMSVIPVSAASAPSADRPAIEFPKASSNVVLLPQMSGPMPIINPNADPTGKCPPISRYEAARRGGKLNPELLNQLPGADMYLAVYRKVGGCVSPIIAAYGIGGAAAPKAGRR